MDGQGEKTEESIDEREIRCPKLGHQVPFCYCQKETMGQPCSRTLICWEAWSEAIDLLKRKLSRDAWDRCFNTPPKPKIATLLELIERAKKLEQERRGH